MTARPMTTESPILSMWRRLSPWYGGKYVFSRFICLRVPYFGSIAPRMVVLGPGYCEVHMKKRRAVTNHLGTVHAIAMCNLAELTGGMAGEVSLPNTHRWIPKSMTVEYLKKAQTHLRAVSEIQTLSQLDAAMELPITVNVFDAHDELVFRAVIAMWISPKNS